MSDSRESKSKKESSPYDRLFDDIFSLYGKNPADEITQQKTRYVCELINLFDLKSIQPTEKSSSKGLRIYLYDTAIKTGNLDVIKALTQRIKSQELSEEIQVPSQDNPEFAFRPSFWLPLIMTRPYYLDEKKVKEITKYICSEFDIPEKVQIQGKTLSQIEYLQEVDAWKAKMNETLKKDGSTLRPQGYPRYSLSIDASISSNQPNQENDSEKNKFKR